MEANDSSKISGGISIWDLLKEFENDNVKSVDMSDILFLRKFNPILCGILIIVGSFGNVFNVYYFLVTDKVSRFGKRILAAIAVADFFTVMNFPLDLFLKWVWESGFRHLNNTTCMVTNALANLSIDWSVYLLEMLALERFCAVLIPLKVKSICTKRVKLAMLIAVSIVLTPRIALSYKIVRTKTGCMVLDSLVAAISYYFDAAYFWQSSVVLIVTNALILATLMRRKLAQESKISQKSRQTVKLMLGLSIISLCCTLPYQTFTLLMESALFLQIPYHVYNRIYDLFLVLYYLNNALNFLFYLINSADYRARILKLITAGKVDLTNSGQ